MAFSFASLATSNPFQMPAAPNPFQTPAAPSPFQTPAPATTQAPSSSSSPSPFQFSFQQPQHQQQQVVPAGQLSNVNFELDGSRIAQMDSHNGNHEDRANEDDLNIPHVVPSFERKMLEYMAVQTQTLQAMAQTLVNIHQYITEQASLPRNYNPITSDSHQISSVPPPFNKEKLLAMQAQVLQGRMQSNASSPHNMEMTKEGVPTGPVKRQVAEAWNQQKRKRKHEAPKLLMEEQYKVIKTPGACHCCEHYGHPCLQEEASLMTAAARQHYHLDINKKGKLSTQDPVLEGFAQSEDSIQTINLEDWSISFKEYQPSRSKQSKKPTSESSQEKIELPQPLAGNITQSSSNLPQPKVAQPPHDSSIKKNLNAQAIPPKVTVEQKGNQDGHIKGLCFRCGEEGHYVNKCKTKCKTTRSRDAGLFCLKCGEDGHLASWCAKEDDNQPQDQSLNSLTFGQTSSAGLLVKKNDQDASAKKGCHHTPTLNSHTPSSCQDTTKARKPCFCCKEEGHLVSQCLKKRLDQNGEEY